MKFSTRTTYGLRAMINLAKNKGQESLSLTTIALEEGISSGYLERIFSLLKNEGLVISEKGKSGGYKLARKANRIIIYDIVRALEGDMSLFHCLNEEGKIICGNKCNCGATKVLSNIQTAVKKTLKKMKLSDLL